MVFDKKRVLSGLLLFVFLSVVFFLKINLILIFLLIFLTFYDLVFSKIISIKKLIFFTIPILGSLIFFYISNLNPLYLSLLFFIFLILSILNIKNNFFLFVTICLFFYILIYLNNFDNDLIFILIFLSFLNDTTAFVIGKSVGGPLIVPKISPNKTWSGTLSSFLVSFIFIYFMQFNFIESILISCSLFFGDLFFSYIKRKYYIKDFSNIIPGHGGILDRIDSIFFSSVIVFIFSFI